ncbi:MAG: hypothetical protein Ct9H300mP32_5590 [Verrucomicrobiota bacterium]|nr:MAG: hypothetical protein Ct9H300mP32_5590 [Verrucomicrobiota bacterium]
MTDAGTRVPLIASWPTGIKQPGRVVDDLVEFSDLMPTLCEVTGANLPSNYPGRRFQHCSCTSGQCERSQEGLDLYLVLEVRSFGPRSGHGSNKQYSLLAKQTAAMPV